MILLGAVTFLVALLLMIFSVLDIATTPSGHVRRLPKAVWIVVAVIIVVIGPLAWLFAGRPRPDQQPVASSSGHRSKGRPAPEDDDAFVRDMRRRAEQQRAEAERLRREPDEEG